MPNGNGQPTCFVVMGFGVKTDFQSSPQRKLDLNRTYEDIIEPAVTACKVECIRADKIIHSTVIDKPMYEQLLDADLVIADLSTSNANAIYELGVRHALRPHTTIVMAENGFSFPFDLNHLSILKYQHMGEGILFGEVNRVRDALKEKINFLINRKEVDSPVFMFLPDLLPRDAAPAPPAPMAPKQDDKSFAELMQTLIESLDREKEKAKKAASTAADWIPVVEALDRLKKLQPEDPYIIQQLALATYKSKRPDAVQALRDAKQILLALGPDTSSDAETVGLWGAIHKRLYDSGKSPADLNTAVRAYARGYFIRDDHYNGINFAFLLNVRAAISQGDDATADRVIARRTRNEVLALCDAAIAKGTLKGDEEFWVQATKVEALLGLGRQAESDALRQQITTSPAAAPWMVDSMNGQLKALTDLKP